MSAAGCKHPRDDSPDDSAAASRRVQPRHFHAGPNLSDTAAPVGKLYCHTLESIFAFCDFKQLCYVSRVSRSWRAASLSMRPLRWCCSAHSRQRVVDITGSSLMGQHVHRLQLTEQAATPETLQLVAGTLPHLQVLTVELDTPTDAPLTFPPQLLELQIHVIAGFSDAAVNAAVEEVARLGHLHELRLKLSDLTAALSFAPLARMPSLRRLTLMHTDKDWKSGVFSSAQINQLRSITGLTSFTPFPWHRSVLNPHSLLAAPHRWQQLQSLQGFCDINDEFGPLLQHLPQLTTLELKIGDASCTHVDWLAQLPKLTTLRFWMGQQGRTDVPRVMVTLQRCTRLTSLDLCGGNDVNNNFFTEEQLGSLLQHLPNLRDLTLTATLQLTSLSFLSRAPSTLTSLALRQLYRRFPAGELKRITSLRQLEVLRIQHDVFDRQLTALELDLMQPPSLLMPSLREFQYVQRLLQRHLQP